MSFPENSPYYVPPMAQNVLDFIAQFEAREAREQLGLEPEIEPETQAFELGSCSLNEIQSVARGSPSPHSHHPQREGGGTPGLDEPSPDTARSVVRPGGRWCSGRTPPVPPIPQDPPKSDMVARGRITEIGCKIPFVQIWT